MLKQRQEALFIFITASLNTQTYFFLTGNDKQ